MNRTCESGRLEDRAEAAAAADSSAILPDDRARLSRG